MVTFMAFDTLFKKFNDEKSSQTSMKELLENLKKEQQQKLDELEKER